MNDQYFRKDQKQHAAFGVLKKLTKDKRLRYLFVVVVPVIAFMTFSDKGILTRLSLESKKEEMLVQVQEARQEQLRLQSLSKSLDSDAAVIEKIAREKYGMVKEGETVYKVKKEEK